MHTQINEILGFWFGALAQGFPVKNRDILWWAAKDENDQLVAELFGLQVHQALRGELDYWAKEPMGRLALILLLDQFTRMMFRGHSDAFSGDAKALKLTLEACHQKIDQAYECSERAFLYMPLQHAEDTQMQAMSISCFEQMLVEVSGLYKLDVEKWLDFAYQNQRQIEAFGRFPQRNEVLGRSSTPEELAFLLQTQPTKKS